MMTDIITRYNGFTPRMGQLLGFLCPRNPTVFRVGFQIIVPLLQYFMIFFGSSKYSIR